METVIYGASDDLIEIDGAVSNEVDCYMSAKKGLNILCSDGTNGVITFGATWNIGLTNEGELFSALIKGNEDDNFLHENELAILYDVPSYSDLLILKEGLLWVKIGKKTYKK